MKEFPECLNVKNKESFRDITYNRILCYLRKQLYEHIIGNDENNYFDFDKFRKSYSITQDDNNKMVNTVVKELTELGWKCKLSFGGTGLFIYSTENPPSNCWESDF